MEVGFYYIFILVQIESRRPYHKFRLRTHRAILLKQNLTTDESDINENKL